MYVYAVSQSGSGNFITFAMETFEQAITFASDLIQSNSSDSIKVSNLVLGVEYDAKEIASFRVLFEACSLPQLN